MWQTKYASAIPKHLGEGVDFRPCSESDFPHGASVVRDMLDQESRLIIQNKFGRRPTTTLRPEG